ncbi:MAG: hypothetical protein Q8778_02485 [Sweet potato little leaf phytoplasma]|nr:hypothetical protein [Sweet potato little leaf phytoplasma]
MIESTKIKFAINNKTLPSENFGNIIIKLKMAKQRFVHGMHGILTNIGQLITS